MSSCKTSIALSEDEVGTLDALAAYSELSRNQMIRCLIITAAVHGADLRLARKALAMEPKNQRRIFREVRERVEKGESLGELRVEDEDFEFLQAWAGDAFRMLSRGVQLMPLEQLSQWEGVRGLIELCPVPGGKTGQDAPATDWGRMPQPRGEEEAR